jgi:hypothetical protein
MRRSNDKSVKVIELPGPMRVEDIKNVVVSFIVSILLFTYKN